MNGPRYRPNERPKSNDPGQSHQLNISSPTVLGRQ